MTAAPIPVQTHSRGHTDATKHAFSSCYAYLLHSLEYHLQYGYGRLIAIPNRSGSSAQQDVNGRRVEGHPSLDLGGPSQRKPARKRAFGPSFLPAFFVFPPLAFPPRGGTADAVRTGERPSAFQRSERQWSRPQLNVPGGIHNHEEGEPCWY